MTRDEIAAVMAKVPLLTAFGIGIFDPRGKTPAERDREMESEKAALLDDVDGCSRAEEWLGRRAKIKTPSFSSYYLKHIAAHEVGYLTNGAFIAAAIHLGFSYRIDGESPNPLIGVSRRCVPNRPAV